jgi:molybdopterin synthase sulfur carrier subunit
MPTVKVRAFATLSEFLGSKTLDVSTSATTIRELIDFIGEKYNPRFKLLLIDPETREVRRFYKIFVNGRDIDFLDKMRTKLKSGDVVVFFPPVGGG